MFFRITQQAVNKNGIYDRDPNLVTDSVQRQNYDAT